VKWGQERTFYRDGRATVVADAAGVHVELDPERALALALELAGEIHWALFARALLDGAAYSRGWQS
jgi:hypothetical protein